MVDVKLIEVLFPYLAAVRVDGVSRVGGVVRIEARTSHLTATCPGCGTESGRVHARYVRRLADAAVGGQRMVIWLRVRRFACVAATCVKRTFAEQVAGLTVAYGRVSLVLKGVQEKLAAVVAGQAGTRLTRRIAIPASRSTLLRRLRAMPLPQVTAPKVLGVDDFAIRRGQTYASILIDMATHRPIAVLGDRSAATFAAWLREHPGVEIICRDRAGNYAEGGRTGAPDAVQVADRYHLWANLGEAVEKTVITHCSCLAEPKPAEQQAPTAAEPAAVVPDGLLDVNGNERRLVARTRERYAAVYGLLAQGASVGAICRQLALDRTTVWRFARAESLDELLFKATHRENKLDRFKPYLIERWNNGHTDVAALHAEIAQHGYEGGMQTVYRFVRRFRGHATVGPPAPRQIPPKPRRLARWIMTRPDHLTAGQAVTLKEICARCPELDRASQHVRAFAQMMTQLQGDQLEDWLTAVEADTLTAFRSLAIGLRRDQAAVTAGLTLPWSSGAVEGAVTRAKALKRLMYGRANLDLLTRRILLPN